jgi:hypothetical protein
MNSGAMAGKGSSNCRSSSAGARAVLSGGRTSGFRRFQGNTTLPRLSACSVSAAGSWSVASGAFNPARACRMGSGQPVVIAASGTLMYSVGPVVVAAGAGGGAADVGVTGALAGDGLTGATDGGGD